MTTDEPDEPLTPLAPGDEARIRALLSDARASGPMPAEVAGRMEQALIGLAADRAVGGAEPSPATGSEATVIPLVRTRRHRVVAVLGAAAAVAVFGLGIATFFDGDSESLDDTGAADSGGVHRGDAADNEAVGKQPSAAAESDGRGTEETTADLEDAPWVMRVTSEHGPYVVHSRHVTRDLARVQAAVLDQPRTAHYGKTTIHEPRDFSCPTAQWGRGILVAARYDDAPAYVAFRQPMGDTQVVEVLQCGTGDLLRSTTLPIR
jgi:hypothetical protein